MDEMYKFTALGRPIDPAYPTNRLILIVTVIAAILAGVIGLMIRDTVGDALLTGVVGGGVTLLGWIIGRELDPDHDYSAFVGAGLAWTAAFFFSAPNFLILLTINALLRIVNRTVGLPAKLGDTIMVTVLVLASIFLAHWTIGLVAIVAFALDAVLKDRHPLHWLSAGVVAVGTIGFLVSNEVALLTDLTPAYLVAAVVISLLYLYVMLNTREVRSKCDATDDVLDLRRVQMAMGLGLFAAWSMFLNGDTGFIAVVPLWANLLAVPVYRFVVLPQLGSNALNLETNNTEN